MTITKTNKSLGLFEELSEEHTATISGGVVEVSSSAQVRLSEPYTNKNVLVIDRMPNLLAPNNNRVVERSLVTNNGSLRVAVRVSGV